MNAFHEYALLFAIAVPVVAILGLNIFLLAGGERGTGLLPSSRPFPVEPTAVRVDDPPHPVAEPGAPANDEFERRAA